MKKLTLFVKDASRKQALYALRALGVVHLKTIARKQVADVNDVVSGIDNTERAILVLRQYKQVIDKRKASRHIANIPEKIEKILKLYDNLKAGEQELEKICQGLDWYKPWGCFNPEDIQALSGKGVHIKLYQINKQQYQEIQDRKDTRLIYSDKGYMYIAHIAYNKNEDLPFKKRTLPGTGYESLCDSHTALKKQISETNSALQADAHSIGLLTAYKKELEKTQCFLQAMHGMGHEENIAYLQGYVPADRHYEIARFAESSYAGYVLEEPGDIDDVPTLIRNPRWIEIISPVFKFMSTVPGYGEYDISAWFLLFFSLFFAMLVGDAGYGVIFFLATLFVHKKLKHLPRQPIVLMYVLSLATIAWGAITGTWFGAEAIARLPFFSHLVIQDISSFAADNQNIMIFICFTIGIIHLTIAHLLVGLRILNSLKALAELGWILVLWALYFLAGTIIARPMPALTLPVLALGAVLLLVFSEPQKNIFKAVALSLTNIPLKIISSFADLVSYIRLFAVGSATVVLASTFNELVLGIGFNSIISGLAASVILFLGHALNIALAFMAVIVHGIRLNMLEFSGQMGMSWSGKEYAPFKE